MKINRNGEKLMKIMKIMASNGWRMAIEISGNENNINGIEIMAKMKCRRKMKIKKAAMAKIMAWRKRRVKYQNSKMAKWRGERK
jgi:hypothetical protein